MTMVRLRFAAYWSVWTHLRRASSIRSHYDVCIVGGGIMGSSSAFFLASRIPSSSVCVIEKDPTYSRASTVLSVGSIRQQFSITENIQMSLYGAEFLRNIDHYLRVPGGDQVDVNYFEKGYLFLATEKERHILWENYELQRSVGAEVSLLEPKELKRRFPWLETSDIAVGCLGTRNEGWFDPWLLLSAMKKKVVSLGVLYIHGTVESLVLAGKQIESVEVLENGADSPLSISCNYLVNCAGPSAAEVSRMAGIGSDTCTVLSQGDLSVMRTDLPVSPRKRMVFVFKCPEGPKDDCPLVVSPFGIYFRMEGNGGIFIAGKPPPPELDIDAPDLTVDYDYFNEEVWPILAHHVPAFNSLKVQHAWAGYYDYNTFDQNAIIGVHPVITNFVFCNGFSGHGIQQFAAAGRAVSEIVADGESVSLSLKRFGFDRVIDGNPLKEKNVV